MSKRDDKLRRVVTPWLRRYLGDWDGFYYADDLHDWYLCDHGLRKYWNLPKKVSRVRMTMAYQDPGKDSRYWLDGEYCCITAELTAVVGGEDVYCDMPKWVIERSNNLEPSGPRWFLLEYEV